MILSAWISAEEGEMDIHEWSGYALIVLVVFRIVWGFIGSTNARFSAFLRGPKAVIAYLKEQPHTEGHNPAGGWAIIAMLSLILIQAISGLFNSDDVLLFGPLYHLVDSKVASLMHETHEVTFNLLLLMIALHITAIIIYRLVRQQNLVKPMLTGGRSTDQSLYQAPVWLAIVLIAIVAGALYVGLSLVPEPTYFY